MLSPSTPLDSYTEKYLFRSRTTLLYADRLEVTDIARFGGRYEWNIPLTLFSGRTSRAYLRHEVFGGAVLFAIFSVLFLAFHVIVAPIRSDSYAKVTMASAVAVLLIGIAMVVAFRRRIEVVFFSNLQGHDLYCIARRKSGDPRFPEFVEQIQKAITAVQAEPA